MQFRNERVILLDQLRKNMSAIRGSVPPSAGVMAVVKADAYGHGAYETADAVLRSGADMLAVASVGEGVYLRERGITAPILVLGAVTDWDVEEGVRNRLIQTVCSAGMVESCGRAADRLGTDAKVHLKIDTGMGRIGVRTREEREQVLRKLEDYPRVHLAGAFTHFSDADGGEEGMRYTDEQHRRFLALTGDLPAGVLRHCDNSAGIHRRPEYAMDLVRAGISLYGYPPVDQPLPLRPCMRWTAKISYIKEIPAGEYISYGRQFRTERTTRAATITCGYGDGYHRRASGKAQVLIHGRRAGILGRICMDQMIADVTEIPEARTGDEVVLIGRDGREEITAQDIADWADTISYEILLSVGSRVERRFADEEDG